MPIMYCTIELILWVWISQLGDHLWKLDPSKISHYMVYASFMLQSIVFIDPLIAYSIVWMTFLMKQINLNRLTSVTPCYTISTKHGLGMCCNDLGIGLSHYFCVVDCVSEFRWKVRSWGDDLSDGCSLCLEPEAKRQGLFWKFKVMFVEFCGSACHGLSN